MATKNGEMGSSEVGCRFCLNILNISTGHLAGLCTLAQALGLISSTPKISPVMLFVSLPCNSKYSKPFVSIPKEISPQRQLFLASNFAFFSTNNSCTISHTVLNKLYAVCVPNSPHIHNLSSSRAVSSVEQ